MKNAEFQLLAVGRQAPQSHQERATIIEIISHQFTIGQERVPFTIDAHRSPHQQYFANRSFIAKQVGNVRDVGAEIGYTWNVGFPIIVNAGIFNGSGLTNQKDYWTKGVNYSAKAQFLFPNVNLVLSTQKIKIGRAHV